jgi:hypothetical protein
MTKPSEYAMKLVKVLGLGALVLVGGALPAMAGPGKPHLDVFPSPVFAGQTLHVEGSCGDGAQPALITSTGFTAPVRIGGPAKVVAKTGRYTATMKCPGLVVNTPFEVIDAPRISLSAKQVAPGEGLSAALSCPPGGGGGTVHSAGFVKDIALSYAEFRNGQGTGVGKAVTKPGVYTVTATCNGKTVSTTLTVGKPQSQVAVKPKGAPQTGGGFFAD